MRYLLVSLIAVVMAGLLTVGCAQATSPAPTSAPLAPTRAAEPAKAQAEPTKAPTAPPASPTAAPAKETAYPEQGKTITIIVPGTAGGSTDLGARTLAAQLEAMLGVPVQVLNKSGAGVQAGSTEVAMARPDGYTIGNAPLFSVITTYLDPKRNAVYSRKSYEPIAQTTAIPMVAAVRAESPYKTLTDLVDASKANPETIKVASAGIGGIAHLTILELQRVSGAKFNIVKFDGGAQMMTAVLGGHVDAVVITSPEALAHTKSGRMRILGVADQQEDTFLPDVKTFASQGYKVSMISPHVQMAPVGTPKTLFSNSLMGWC